MDKEPDQIVFFVFDLALCPYLLDKLQIHHALFKAFFCIFLCLCPYLYLHNMFSFLFRVQYFQVLYLQKVVAEDTPAEVTPEATEEVAAELLGVKGA